MTRQHNSASIVRSRSARIILFFCHSEKKMPSKNKETQHFLLSCTPKSEVQHCWITAGWAVWVVSRLHHCSNLQWNVPEVHYLQDFRNSFNAELLFVNCESVRCSLHKVDTGTSDCLWLLQHSWTTSLPYQIIKHTSSVTALQNDTFSDLSPTTTGRHDVPAGKINLFYDVTALWMKFG